MSISARNWAWDASWTARGIHVPMKEKFTLLCLAEHENPEHGFSWPSQETIAARTEQSVRTVRNHIATLIARQMITKGRRPSAKGEWDRNVYFLNVPDSYREKDPEWMRWNG